MFAIVEIAGQQHKVAAGDILDVEKLNAKEGEKGGSEKVLLRFDDKKTDVGTPYVEGASVEYKIVKHDKAEKIRVYKKKAKKRFERTQGHRQPFTRIEITAVK